MQHGPLFIVGAPRSGTTFLCALLNTHPLIELTNECRIFVLLKRMLEVESRRPDLLASVYRERLEAFGRRTLGGWVERFYREELGVDAPIWGDKHPAYGDPTVLSGRTGFLDELPAHQTLTLSYRHLVEDGSATVARIGRFLGLADASPISDFLASQRHAPTPFSDPVRDIGDLYMVPTSSNADGPLLDLAGHAAVNLGYAAA